MNHVGFGPSPHKLNGPSGTDLPWRHARIPIEHPDFRIDRTVIEDGQTNLASNLERICGHRFRNEAGWHVACERYPGCFGVTQPGQIDQTDDFPVTGAQSGHGLFNIQDID